MCPAVPIGNSYGVNDDTWKASAYEALSLTSRVSAGVKTQSVILMLALEVWKLDGILRHFLEAIYRAASNPTPPSSEPVSKEQILEASDICLKIHRDIDRMYAQAKRIGLTNRRFVGAALNSVKVRAEEILDIGDALALSVEPAIDAMFARSLNELRDGEVYDLPA